MVLSVARTALAIALAIALLAAFARGQVAPCREYQLAIGEQPTKAWREVHLLRGAKTVTCRLRLRGAAKNRSFAIELPERERLAPAIEASKLYLLNLAADDPHGFELRFCTDVARHLGLFPSHAQFARVAIDGGKPQLYLQVERPVDALRRAHANTIAVHRLRDKGIETTWTARAVSPHKGLLRLEYALDGKDPAQRAARLGRVLDLPSFYTWMAWNSLIQNRDSGDELFLFERRAHHRSAGKLGVMGWDYDELQGRPKHAQRVVDTPLTWGASTAIEREITRNPKLYRAYRAHLAKLLFDELHPQRLLAQLDHVQRELRILAPTNAKRRQRALDRFRNRLLDRHRVLVENLGPAAKPGK